MSDKENVLDNLKELDDLEFEIMFIDNIFKKLKLALNSHSVRTESLLFVYYSVVEHLKSFKSLAKESNRSIPHEDTINLIISKSESFLSTVANNEDKALYTHKSLDDVFELVKSLLFMLKSELVESPKYTHLKPNTA